jgi:hypothetical protein
VTTGDHPQELSSATEAQRPMVGQPKLQAPHGSGAGIGAGSIDDHLSTIARSGTRVMGETIAAHRSDLGKVHQVDLDIAAWISRIDGPWVAQMSAARKELVLAEYCVASGLYRPAYTSLRLFLELGFASVHFSVNEFERRKWLSDRLDFSWSAALQDDSGLLSHTFVREFSPTLIADARVYARAAQECYRHCSQFVHGKAALSSQLPASIEYSEAVVSDWCTTALNAAESLLFLLYIRYGEELDANGTPALQESIVARFGHLHAVRMLVGLTGE